MSFTCKIDNKSNNLVFIFSKEEILANLWKLDRNKDGRLDAKELITFVRASGTNLTMAQAEAFIALLDEDGDGTLEFEELAEALADK